MTLSKDVPFLNTCRNLVVVFLHARRYREVILGALLVGGAVRGRFVLRLFVAIHTNWLRVFLCHSAIQCSVA